jgi:3-deoxy-D-manno-octulosonic-acid transferase
VVVDTVGDLIASYDLATCTFVGRSLVPPGGGQNMMEPAALGKPVVVGPHTGNFKPEMSLLLADNAVSVVHGLDELTVALDRFLSDRSEAERAGALARAVALRSRGALERTLDILSPLLEACTAP